MGRYYEGDHISGQFWIGIQGSDAVDQFGGISVEPNTVEYFFDLNHLEGVQTRLNIIDETLQKNLDEAVYKKIGIQRARGDLHQNEDEYPDEVLDGFYLVKNVKPNVLEYLADYELGCRIEWAILKHNFCEFEADL